MTILQASETTLKTLVASHMLSNVASSENMASLTAMHVGVRAR